MPTSNTARADAQKVLASVGSSAKYLISVGNPSYRGLPIDSLEDLWTILWRNEDAVAGDRELNTARGISYHIDQISTAIRNLLWPREQFLEPLLIGEALFDQLVRSSTDPVFDTLAAIERSRAARQALLVFPLRSFGIAGAGGLRAFHGRSVTILDARRGFAITPQTNDLVRTINFLNEVGPRLGLKRAIGADEIEHIYKSRGAKWLERNPLIVVAINSATGAYFANERLLMSKLRALSSALVMLGVMQRPLGAEPTIFSTSRINNWETLDTRHYLIANQSEIRPVPVHGAREVLDLSVVGVDVNVRYWSQTSQIGASIFDSVEDLHQGYLRWLTGDRGTLGTLHRKLFDSLDYFRRSVRDIGDPWSATISLATAYEMLLTDKYERGVAQTMKVRARQLLRGVPGTRQYQRAIESVYYARNSAVHAGQLNLVDLHAAHRGFILCFVELMRRRSGLQNGDTEPIKRLTP